MKTTILSLLLFYSISCYSQIIGEVSSSTPHEVEVSKLSGGWFQIM